MGISLGSQLCPKSTGTQEGEKGDRRAVSRGSRHRRGLDACFAREVPQKEKRLQLCYLMSPTRTGFWVRKALKKGPLGILLVGGVHCAVLCILCVCGGGGEER